jgi:hypothetical protein
MPKRLLLLSILIVGGLSFVGCSVSTDLGTPCVLVKADPTDTDASDGIRSVPITQSDFDTEPTGDLISFGAVECEDLVCVQDAKHRTWATGDAAPTTALTGYCSRSCVAGSSSACTPQADEANDSNADLKMACRSLLLDEATMGRLCQADPQKCQAYFGNNKSPYFCARGGTP